MKTNQYGTKEHKAKEAFYAGFEAARAKNSSGKNANELFKAWWTE